MLKFLSIENFALIDRLEVEFQPGLNLITGETGSGKSILVDAVALLVGERASQEMVRSGFDRARIEGLFSLSGENPARQRLARSGIAVEEDTLIIRREIALGGSNKVFVNGTLSTQGFLAEIGPFLADIHGQHDQQLLLQPLYHLEFIDAFGQNHSLAAEVSRCFQDLEELRSRLRRLKQDEKERLQKIDHLHFQIGDIEKLQLRPGLDVELERDKQMLTTAERRYQLSAESYQLLYEREESALALLGRMEKNLEHLAALDGSFDPLANRLRETRYQLEELAFLIRDYTAQIDFSASRLDSVEERLAEIQKARRKYGSSVDEILTHCEKIKREVEELAGAEEQIEELETGEGTLASEYLRLARRLSDKRREDATQLSRRVEQELTELAMTHTLFTVALERSESQATEKGIDTAEFLVSPNPGEPPKPLARIASGGELSRIILALKSVLTLENYPKTLVFDEVDAGIGGGRVASTLGEKLARLASRHQVFCVTHLPQIASYAQQHFHVDKQARGERTTVQIASLSEKDRVEELARMMAGEAVTETTRKQARELLKRKLTR